jgi:hypothetical protein
MENILSKSTDLLSQHESKIRITCNIASPAHSDGETHAKQHIPFVLLQENLVQLDTKYSEVGVFSGH